MEFGICIVSIAPMRKLPDDRSEMVSQALFGEAFEILGTQKNWAQIKLAYDGYIAWIDVKQMLYIDEFRYNSLTEEEYQMVGDIAQIIINTRTQDITTLPIGAILPQFLNGKIKVRDNFYEYDGITTSSITKPNRNIIIENAMLYQNAPYLWGGKTPFGIDCSGFTQMVYKLSGIRIPRDSSKQAENGVTINFITDARKGDLAFFDDEEGNIIHVGILMGNNKIIHASAYVRIDSIDHEGIYNNQTQKYTHKLRLIKSYL